MECYEIPKILVNGAGMFLVLALIMNKLITRSLRPKDDFIHNTEEPYYASFEKFEKQIVEGKKRE